MIYIQNNDLIVSITELGAELQSVFHKPTQTELIWQRDPEFWHRSSPILFPTIGKLKDDKYIWQDHLYSLPRHGFARNQTFNVIHQDDTKVVFECHSNSETLQVYPFHFNLILIYTLNDNVLNLSYQVKNLNESEMYFSLGAHPAFALGESESEYENYYIEFPDDNTLNAQLLQNELRVDSFRKIDLEQHKLPLNYALFHQDALVLKDLKSEEIYIKNKQNKKFSLKFESSLKPYFGIWAAKEANFVCLEPWAGVADSVNHNQKLEEKEGIVKLNANETWEKFWQITLEI